MLYTGLRRHESRSVIPEYPGNNLNDQPFTAPTVIPLIKYFCTKG